MGTLTLWAGFHVAVLLLLALDLGVFHRPLRTLSGREAALRSVLWVLLALLFNAAVLRLGGSQKGIEFFTGYLIEYALAIDNVFVFVVVFHYFGVPAPAQHRLLLWGMLGAMVMRGALIVAGVGLLRRFEWVLYLFGALVLYSGIRLLLHKPEDIHPERNPVLRLAQRLVPFTSEYQDDSFFVRQGGLLRATPLFLVLLVVEATDAVFAFDSIPVIFAITRDPFVVYTSNIFAVLGLRAFYFLLAAVMPRIRYLNAGLSAVLFFIGAEMMAARWVRVPILVSLLVVVSMLTACALASFAAAHREKRAAPGNASAAVPENPRTRR